MKNSNGSRSINFPPHTPIVQKVDLIYDGAIDLLSDASLLSDTLLATSKITKEQLRQYLDAMELSINGDINTVRLNGLHSDLGDLGIQGRRIQVRFDHNKGSQKTHLPSESEPLALSVIPPLAVDDSIVAVSLENEGGSKVVTAMTPVHIASLKAGVAIDYRTIKVLPPGKTLTIPGDSKIALISHIKDESKFREAVQQGHLTYDRLAGKSIEGAVFFVQTLIQEVMKKRLATS